MVHGAWSLGALSGVSMGPPQWGPQEDGGGEGWREGGLSCGSSGMLLNSSDWNPMACQKLEGSLLLALWFEFKTRFKIQDFQIPNFRLFETCT